jgi:hypothetical protein
MNKIELAPGIFIYKDVILNNENLHIDIEEALSSTKIDWSESSVYIDGRSSVVDTKFRDTHSVVIPYNLDFDESNPISMFRSSLSQLFKESFAPAIIDYSSNYGLKTEWHDSYSILKYGIGQKFTNHVDDNIKYHRRLSLVYYINDDYTGGEIIFPRFNITYKPNKNELLLFPSTYVYNHSVVEVADGIRYSVVSWMR